MRTQNQTAAERREAVLDAAVVEFALKGLHGTSTEDIARRAGISQPYVFRLFSTKKELFIAAAERVCDRIEVIFRQAAASGAPDALAAMGQAYNGLLGERHELLMLLQSYAAAGDPEVRPVVCRRLQRILALVREAAGVSMEQASAFFATGMLLTIATVAEVPELLGLEDWEEAERLQLEIAAGRQKAGGWMLRWEATEPCP
jgi:AcrR family transcriptional regulator